MAEHKVLRPKQARGRARVDALLKAAAALIGQKGVDGVAFSEIARAAGTAQGSLYQFFPSKEALVTALHTQLAEEIVAEVVRCRDAFCDGPEPRDAARLVDLLVSNLAAFYAANPAYREIRLALPRTAEVATIDVSADARVAELLAEMLGVAGLSFRMYRHDLFLRLLIEIGDALLPWAGADPARQKEIARLLKAYLATESTDPSTT